MIKKKKIRKDRVKVLPVLAKAITNKVFLEDLKQLRYLTAVLSYDEEKIKKMTVKDRPLDIDTDITNTISPLMTETWRVYKMYRKIFLQTTFCPERVKMPFSPDHEVFKKNRNCYMGKNGFGWRSNSEVDPEIIWELIPEITINTIADHGDEIINELEKTEMDSKKLEKFRKFYEIIKQTEWVTSYENVNEKQIESARETKRGIIREFKADLLSEDI